MNERLEQLTRVLHPVPKHQDGRCPFIKWMGEDLMHCPGIGEYKCRISTYNYGEYNQNQDYNPCISNKHEECERYVKQQGE
ncbi:MAG: hypothetical protein KC535_03930 [Nanoarchaeota archaeon]|nr:hypothetical protein [Nanoarchaeota archaeon]